MSPEGMIPLIHCREEEYFKIPTVFQGIFSLSTDLGGPSAWYIDIWTVLSGRLRQKCSRPSGVQL